MDPYVGEIRMFAGNYAPSGWLFCNGQTLQPVNYQTLFSVIGTTFGGDGQNTFLPPNLRGLSPMHAGEGPGLTPRVFGSTGGEATITLDENQMPVHDHQANCQSTANTTSPNGAIWATTPRSGGKPVYASTVNTSMNPQLLSPTGGSQPHNNMQPYTTLNFIIAAEGVYPPKS